MSVAGLPASLIHVETHGAAPGVWGRRDAPATCRRVSGGRQRRGCSRYSAHPRLPWVPPARSTRFGGGSSPGPSAMLRQIVSRYRTPRPNDATAVELEDTERHVRGKSAEGGARGPC